ncbi:MAG TPA: N-acetylmuramoyl-L-alanine amidase [Vicinamibacterales bacterium]
MTQHIRLCVLLALVLAASGQASHGAPATARQLYAAAVTRERALRAVTGKAAAPLEDYRTTVGAYDAVVRRFPSSGYVDNALWQGAAVASDAFERFGEERDRSTTRRMLELLVGDYPASPFVAKAREALKRLAERPSVAEKATSPPPARPTPRRVVVLRAITRTAMPDRVRVTIELDAPTTYRTERVENPQRVLFDLADTRLGESVPEGTLSYADDIVRRVRIGLHSNQVTRVVVDLDGVAGYAVSTLERPYRIVVECERAVPASAPRTSDVVQPALPGGTGTVRAPRLPVLQGWTVHTPWGVLPTVEPADAERLHVPLAPESPSAPATAQTARSSSTPKSLAPGAGPTPPRLPSTGRGLYTLARQLGLGASKIVIDPGHGGYDPGALGAGISEADVVLDVALRLEALLREAGVDVILTRRTDEFVPLEERPAIATREQADLFLSIHANASRTRTARGVESYYLNFATDPNAEAVAARENAATGRTINNLPEILKAIALNSKLDESRSFATLIQRAMASQLSTADSGLRNLGVKQAPFVVLIGAAMPSVLVEISFITNAQEGRLLRSGAYRQRIAQALFDAVRGYQKSLKSAQAAPYR